MHLLCLVVVLWLSVAHGFRIAPGLGRARARAGSHIVMGNSEAIYRTAEEAAKKNPKVKIAEKYQGMKPGDMPTKKNVRRQIMSTDRYKRGGTPFDKGIHKDVASKMSEKFAGELIEQMKESPLRELVKGEGASQVTFVLAKEFGFCWGVERSIELAWAAREAYPDQKMHITNELIHNPGVNDLLRGMDIEFMEKDAEAEGGKRFDTVEEGDVVILPAFGASLEEMELLHSKSVTTVDTTCPWVSKVWTTVDKHQRAEMTSLIHGKYQHEEAIATASMAETYLIIKDMKQALDVAAYILQEPGCMTDEEFMDKDFDPKKHLKKVGPCQRVACATTAVAPQVAGFPCASLRGRGLFAPMKRRVGTGLLATPSARPIWSVGRDVEARGSRDLVAGPPQPRGPGLNLGLVRGPAHAISPGRMRAGWPTRRPCTRRRRRRLASCSRRYGPENIQEHFAAFDTICDATQVRQDAVQEMSEAAIEDPEFDFVLVVGGWDSSNTAHLLEIPHDMGLTGYHVNTAQCIRADNSVEWRAVDGTIHVTPNFLPLDRPARVGVTSGASTPDSVVQECLEAIAMIKKLNSGAAPAPAAEAQAGAVAEPSSAAPAPQGFEWGGAY